MATADPPRELRISMSVDAEFEKAARTMTSSGESETAVVAKRVV